MIKYCMYLPEPMINKLKKLSKDREMPVSELVRRFVDMGLSEVNHRDHQAVALEFDRLSEAIKE